MSEFFGNNQQGFTCDSCGKEWLIYDGKDLPQLPLSWQFIAFGRGQHTENTDDVKHFCSDECRNKWQLVRIQP